MLCENKEIWKYKENNLKKIDLWVMGKIFLKLEVGLFFLMFILFDNFCFVIV